MTVSKLEYHFFKVAYIQNLKQQYKMVLACVCISTQLKALEPRAPAPALFRDSYLADVTPWLFLLNRILLIETAL